MRILIIARDYKPLPGGIAEYTHQLARQLHAAGDSVTVLAQSTPEAASHDAACPYPVVRHDFSRLGDRGPWALGQRIQLLLRAIAASRPELVICNALGREAQATRLVCRARGLPYVLFAYGREIARLRLLQERKQAGRYVQAMNLVIQQAAAIVAISRYTQTELLALGVAPTDIVLVRPGIDPTQQAAPGQLSRLGLPPAWYAPTTPVLLTVARLVKRKGIDTVLAALPGVLPHAPDLLYAIAGEGPLAADLTQEIRTAGLAEHVLLLGRVTEAEKSALLTRADLFVMPNRMLEDGDVEGFGIVFLEANLYGKPVIGGDSGGVPDAIAQGRSGLLVAPDDPQALADAILTLLQSSELRQQLGMEGARRARTEFDWFQGAECLRQRLRQLIERNN